MSRAATVTIDLEAIRQNYRLAKSLAPQARAIAIIKADAYGHGAVQVAQALSSEADAFGVACIEEAIQLRNAGINHRLLLLEGFFSADEIDTIVELNLDIAIHCQQQLEQLKTLDSNAKLNIWLKLDTGMHRLGFLPEQFEQAFGEIQALPQVNEIVLTSHFAQADQTLLPVTKQQLVLFDSTIDTLSSDDETGKVFQSLSNSPAVLAWPQSHRDWIRPGIMLYGASPLDKDNEASLALAPAMTLTSEVIAVKVLQPGDAIGYGAIYRCTKPRRIAVVAMGYGDGYPRLAPNGTPVYINGQQCPLVGRVSMDMLTVDVSDLAGVQVGDQVELWGKHVPVTEVARHCGTISYELLTRLTPRAKRQYR